MMSFDPRNSTAGVLAKPFTTPPFAGTAFLVQGGILVTCSHILESACRDEAGHVQLLFYGKQETTSAEILLDNPERDLAVLRPLTLPENVVPLPVAPSESAKDHKFEVLGYPQKAGFPALYAQGDIYGIIHNAQGHSFLQLTSLQITHGYSGGPVIDKKFNAVVGIVSGGIKVELTTAHHGTSFAIATETLKFLHPDLEFITLPPPHADGWLRPSAPRPSKPMVGRQTEFEAVKALLKPGAKAAITAAVQGTPGVGKTVLAGQLAADLDPLFPGGVFFQHLGSEFRHPDLCNPILRRWGSYAFGGVAPDEKFQPTPEEVRALLSNRGSLLVVLDDLWDVRSIIPLQEALPQDASLLVTTRSRRLAQDLHSEIYQLDILTSADALALLQSRLNTTDSGDHLLLEQLAAGLGFHALALDIAGGSLARFSKNRWPSSIQEMIKQVQDGSGFGEIQLPDEAPDPRVEAALFTSYNDLKPESQRRFRLLGAFAPDGPFSAPAAAGVWACALDQAEDQLNLFTERGLLTRHTDQRWRQHALLRAYALALIRKTGEEEFARQVHTMAYSQLMQKASNCQEPHSMQDEYPQLKYAFAWAMEHNLNLAQDLAISTKDLQINLYHVQDSFEWAHGLLSAAYARQESAVIARAHGTLGNALLDLANLPNEDRVTRVHEALAEFDKALQFYRPDTAHIDYAVTQSNRGNTLKTLAQLPGEDRHARLLQSLAAYDEALQYFVINISPHEYALAQYSRGVVLSDLADAPGEYMYARQLEALGACKEAIRFCDPQKYPLYFATIQNGYGRILRDLSMAPGEDSHSCLVEALAAHDKALLYYLPDVTPFDYAITQTNRGLVLRDLSISPGEDYRTCLLKALSAYDEALRCQHPEYSPLEYAGILTNRGLVLTDLSRLPDENSHARLTAALDIYNEALQYQHPDNIPLDYAMTQGNIALVQMLFSYLPEEDNEERVRSAIQSGFTAFKIFRQFGHQSYLKEAVRMLHWISDQTGELYNRLWEDMKLGEPPP